MQRTYCVSLARAGLVALAAIALLLAHPGTSIAGEASESTRAGDGTQLQRGAGYAADGRRASVRSLQRTLRALGLRPGRVDGLFGPQTEAAVTRLQRVAGLAMDGIVGRDTSRVVRELGNRDLRRGAGYTGRGGSERVRRLQRELRQRGFKPGPVDGRFGPRTERAVARMQQAAGLQASGVVNRTTRRLLARAEGDPERGRAERGDRRVAEPAPVPRPASPQATSEPDGFTPGSVMLGAALVLLIGAVVGLALRRVPRTRAGIAAPPAGGVVAGGEAPSVQELKPDPDPEPVSELELEPDPEPELAPVPEVSRTNGQVAAGSNGVLAFGYVTVPRGTDEVHGLREQGGLIDSHCERQGWRLVELVHDKDRGNGRTLDRPGIQYVLDRMLWGEATYLVVQHLRVLGRSLMDLGGVIAAVKRSGGNLAVLDIGLDTGSGDGHVAAEALVSIGAWERRRLAERSRKGLSAARARGEAAGRPAVVDVPGLKERIVIMRADGMTLQAIADQLNAEGIPTIRGGEKWRPSSVQTAAGYRRPRTARGGVL